jgi:peptidoglycan hydrolase CwlO-like protein
MGKVLRIAVVLILLLSIGALALGIILFQQREALKGRTQKSENALAAVAKNLNHAEFSVESIKDFASMDEPLNKLTATAKVTYDDLQSTKKTLEETRTELAATKDKLTATELALDQSKQEVERLTQTVQEKDTQISGLNTKLAASEAENTQLKSQVDDLNTQIAKVTEEKNDLQDKLASTEQDVVRLENEIHIRDGTSGIVKRGTNGKIMLVNPDWSFCVLDVGSDAGLTPNAEMLIHRGDQFIGKIKVGIVKRNMAVADILSGWAQTVPQEGDCVVY